MVQGALHQYKAPMTGGEKHISGMEVFRQHLFRTVCLCATLANLHFFVNRTSSLFARLLALAACALTVSNHASLSLYSLLVVRKLSDTRKASNT